MGPWSREGELRPGLGACSPPGVASAADQCLVCHGSGNMFSCWRWLVNRVCPFPPQGLCPVLEYSLLHFNLAVPIPFGGFSSSGWVLLGESWPPNPKQPLDPLSLLNRPCIHQGSCLTFLPSFIQSLFIICPLPRHESMAEPVLSSGSPAPGSRLSPNVW